MHSVRLLLHRDRLFPLLKVMEHLDLATLRHEREGVRLFASRTSSTPWSTFLYLSLSPNENLAVARSSREDGYLLLAGSVSVESSVHSTGFSSGGSLKAYGGRRPVFRCAPSVSGYVLENDGESTALLIKVAVDMAEPRNDAGLCIAEVNAQMLTWSSAIHGGAGEIATRHVWGPGDFFSSWTFLDHAILARGSSVGMHYHDALEESFVILSGRGYMTVEENTFEVGPGSVTWQGERQGHGIYNPFAERLEFIRIAVARPGETYTSVDVHDKRVGKCGPQR